MSNRYPVEELDPSDDDGRMPENVAQLAERVVGRKIVKAEEGKFVAKEPGYDWDETYNFTITLDDGTRVLLADTHDCCAGTDLRGFLLNADLIDHAILGIRTTGEYEKWHIYADLGDVLTLDVSWSAGNPFYYGYGFDITVVPAKAGA